MLEPSLPFYLSLFGAMMMGAISVPMFTLFGLDGLRLRLDDCKPKLLITNAEKAEIARQIDGVRVIVADDALLAEMAGLPATFEPKTHAHSIERNSDVKGKSGAVRGDLGSRRDIQNTK